MATISAPLPRVTIQFCTQCKWMLRAAYFAQELLSTFGTTLGEVALQPSTGGTFIVSLYTSASRNEGDIQVQSHVLWDRKVEGGFPETKELKRRVRDAVDPGRDLGHVDRKEKNVARIDANVAQHGLREPSETRDTSNDKTEKTEDEQAIRRRLAISNLQAQGEESEKKFPPIDVDGIEVVKESAKGGFKRNQDGSICEDCDC